MEESNLGYIGEVHPTVAENFDLPVRAYVLEIDLGRLFAAALHRVVYRPVSKFPGVDIDLAFLAEDGQKAGDIADAICRLGGEYLHQVELFDIYQGNQLGEGKKSLAYKLKFQAQERTLTAEEVNRQVEQIKAGLKEKFGILLRS